MNRASSQSAGERGFTLVELLVVIAIIVLLVGLTVTVSVSVLRQSEIRETKNVLQLLDMTVQEWEVTSGRQVTWGDGPQYEMQEGRDQILVITELLDVVLRDPGARTIFERIDPRFIYRYEPESGEFPPWIYTAEQQMTVEEYFAGSYTVVDAWEMPIYSTHPGRPWTPEDQGTYLRNDDGTIQTPLEERYGVCLNRRICFVSAGPSRDFGSKTETDPMFPGGMDPQEAVRDNLYSYMPIVPSQTNP